MILLKDTHTRGVGNDRSSEMVNVIGLIDLSGKGAASPPLPPLRTGRETFASSGSSRYKAPRERSRLHDGLIPACWRVMPNFLWNVRSAK